MDYSRINVFFDRIKKIIGTSEFEKQALQEIIKKHLNYEISLEKMTLKNGILSVSVSPLVKNELLIKKDKILEEAKQLGVNIRGIQ